VEVVVEPNSRTRAGRKNRGPEEQFHATPIVLLFEDLTLKPATGELPRLPMPKHPYFDK